MATISLLELRPLIETIVAAGQTVRPVAVLEIAVLVMGFGAWPTVVALFLVSLRAIAHFARHAGRAGQRARQQPEDR